MKTTDTDGRYYADKRLDEPLAPCHLVLEAGEEGFCFSVRDASGARLAAGGLELAYPASEVRLLEQVVRFFETTAPFSGLAWERVDVIRLDDRFTVVPRAFFDPEKKADLLAFALGGMPDRPVCARQVGDAVCLFPEQTGLGEYFSSRTARVEQHHSAEVFLALARSNASQGRSVHLNVAPGFVQAVVLEADDPVLVNVFRCRGMEQMMYYLLLVAERTQTREAEADFVFYGSPQVFLQLRRQLERYPGRYRFARRLGGEGNYSPALDFVAYYDWYNVLNAQL